MVDAEQWVRPEQEKPSKVGAEASALEAPVPRATDRSKPVVTGTRRTGRQGLPLRRG